MKTFIKNTGSLALHWRMVICMGIFLVCSMAAVPVFAQTTAAGGSKIDKSKLAIHGNLRDAQPQHFDNKRSAVVSYNTNGSRKTTKVSKAATHIRTQLGAATKADKKAGTKSVKARKKVKHRVKEFAHKNRPKSRRRH